MSNKVRESLRGEQRVFQIGRGGKVSEHNCGRIHPCADLGEDSPGMKTTVHSP